VFRRHRLTRPRQPALRSRAPGPVSGRLCGSRPVGGPAVRLPFSRCLSAAGVRFLGARFPPGGWALLAVGLPPRLRGRGGPWAGLPRSARVRHGRVGCPLYPGGDGVHTTIGQPSVAVCRLSTAGLSSPRPCNPTRGVAVTRRLRGLTGIHPFGRFPLACGPRTEREPLGFPRASHPAITGRARRDGDRFSDTYRELRLRHRPNLQSTYSLTACDIVSQPSSACARVFRNLTLDRIG
jgi:hypothetical protein